MSVTNWRVKIACSVAVTERPGGSRRQSQTTVIITPLRGCHETDSRTDNYFGLRLVVAHIGLPHLVEEQPRLTAP